MPKIILTHDQIGNLMDEIDIDGYSESEFKEDREKAKKLSRIYEKLHKVYNQ